MSKKDIIENYFRAGAIVEQTPADQIELKLLRLKVLEIPESERPYKLFLEDSKKLGNEIKIMDQELLRKAKIAWKIGRVLHLLDLEFGRFPNTTMETIIHILPSIRKTVGYCPLQLLHKVFFEGDFSYNTLLKCNIVVRNAAEYLLGE